MCLWYYLAGEIWHSESVHAWLSDLQIHRKLGLKYLQMRQLCR